MVQENCVKKMNTVSHNCIFYIQKITVENTVKSVF